MRIRSLALLLPLTIAASAAAAPKADKGKPPSPAHHGPTALHTTHVHGKDASKPGHDDKDVKKDAQAAKPDPKKDAKPDAKKDDAKVGKKDDPKDAKAKPEAKDAKQGDKAKASSKDDPSDAKGAKDAKDAKEKHDKLAARGPCVRFPVWVTRGTEEDFFPLTNCDGTDAPAAIEHLSILARPESAQKPVVATADLAKQKGEMVSPGIKRLDARLPHALQLVLDHFDKPGPARKVHIISGYRPASKGSYHATGQAIDFRIDGVSNEALVSFCKTLSDVGCGYYPNSTFVHMDVRADGTGHVAWIDASGPGEAPRYVSSWPPPPEPTPAVDAMGPDKLLEPAPQDDHPATATDTNDPDAPAERADASM